MYLFNLKKMDIEGKIGVASNIVLVLGCQAMVAMMFRVHIFPSE